MEAIKNNASHTPVLLKLLIVFNFFEALFFFVFTFLLIGLPHAGGGRIGLFIIPTVAFFLSLAVFSVLFVKRRISAYYFYLSWKIYFVIVSLVLLFCKAKNITTPLITEWLGFFFIPIAPFEFVFYQLKYADSAYTSGYPLWLGTILAHPYVLGSIFFHFVIFLFLIHPNTKSYFHKKII